MILDKWKRGTLKLILVLPVAFVIVYKMTLLLFNNQYLLSILLIVLLILYAILIRYLIDKLLFV